MPPVELEPEPAAEPEPEPERYVPASVQDAVAGAKERECGRVEPEPEHKQEPGFIPFDDLEFGKKMGFNFW